MTRWSLGCLVLLAVALFAVHAVLASFLFAEDHMPIFLFTTVEVAIYALAVLVVLRDGGNDPRATRRAVVFILVTAAVLRLMLLFADPISSDANRYVWDGRVQAAGINPYRYIPADPALHFLRDDMIYPEINRADYAPTIYPPFAQIVFFVVTRVSETLTAMKAAMVLFEVATVWAILRLLHLRDMSPARILLYAWHPLPIWEFSGSGHIDAVAVACVTLAILAAELRKPLLAGVALGGAAMVKFFPAVIGPALWRRWDWRLPVAGAATIILLYLPYIALGPKVFGFLGGYSDEEGLSNGEGLFPWALLKHGLHLPQTAFALYMPLAGLLLASLGLIALFRPRRYEVDIGGAFLIGAAFTVLTSPHFPWYFTWLVPFLCFVPSLPVIYLSGSATTMYVLGWPPSLTGAGVLYGPAFALLLAEFTYRTLISKEKRHGHAVASQTIG